MITQCHCGSLRGQARRGRASSRISGASVVGGGPGQFARQFLAWIRLEQSPGPSHVVRFGDHVRLGLGSALQQKLLQQAIRVTPGIA